MKAKKNILTALRRVLVLTFLFHTVFLPFSAGAQDGGLLRTDKAAYTEGEGIFITATGSGNDWVGIYRQGEVPQANATPSIRWYYVAKDGNQSGTAKNIFDSEYTIRKDLADLPAGGYTIYLLENDGYAILDQADITVTAGESGPVAAPASVSYNREEQFPGSAQGKLTITAGEGALPESYVAYWGNAQGRLADYTAFPSIPATGTVTEYAIAANTLIPTGADRILVYASNAGNMSEGCASVMLPEGSNTYDFGTPLYEFQVLSDIHLNGRSSFNDQFSAALEEIKRLSPNSAGIIVNGDITDDGRERTYELFQELIAEAGEDLPPVYCTIGNHDFWDSTKTDAERIATFLEYTNPDSDTVYFDKWINGAHFIFLGSEMLGNWTAAYLSVEQLNWFRETLAENRDENRPIYVFLHQGIPNTVAGTFDYQGWHGIERAEEFAEIIGEYPEVILFTSHSHWQMESDFNMKPRDEQLPTIFNTASLGYLWSDASETIDGSQGYYIQAYADKIVVRGRDFINEQWLPTAQYLVPYASAETGEPQETAAPGTSGTSGTSVETQPAPSTDVSASPSPSPDTGVGGAADIAGLCATAGALIVSGACLVRKRRMRAPDAQ